MMHFVPMAPGSGAPAGKAEAVDQRALRADVDLLDAEVCAARRIANESLDRLNALGQPGIGESSAFHALLDLHRRDKETLFEAMRRLDAAREQLRRTAR